MKIPTNKIVGWQKTKNCLPVLDALVLIQSKEDKLSVVGLIMDAILI